ncbi:MAG: lipopolysaccharide biosynthesis protein [Candidatus Freyarchaeota archaeon]|nr:oligosaccharide flippase family protein [Candidatus Freyrarchaeum guaymaensis]
MGGLYFYGTVSGLEILELIRKGLRVRGFIYVTLGNIANAGLGFLFFFIVARILDVSSYGVISYNVSTGFLGATLAIFGLRTAVITFYPKERNIVLVRQAATFTFLTDAVGIIIILACVLFFNAPLEFAMLILLGSTAFMMATAIALGEQRYGQYARLMIGMRIGQCALLGITYLFIAFTGWFLLWIREIVLLAYSIPYIAAGYRYFKFIRFNFSFSEIYAKWRFCLPAAASSIMTASVGSLDKVIIGALFGMFALGNYHLAFQFLTGFTILPVSLLSFLLPEKSGGAKRREVEILGIAAAALISAAGFLLAPYLIKWFFRGFEGSVSAIQALSLAVVPASVANIRISTLFSEERADLAMASYLAMFGVYLSGIILLGGSMQALGFAISYTIGQAVLAVATVLFSSESWKRWRASRRKNASGEGTTPN